MDATVAIFVIFLALVVVGIPTICITSIIHRKIGAGKKSRNGSSLDAEETKTMQEIYTGLTRMEKRIEALETIIIEKKGAIGK